MIRIFCVGDNENKISEMKAQVESVLPFATVELSTNYEDICYEIDRKDFTLVLTETKTQNFDGLKLARFIHDTSPQTKVIFVTENKDYAVPAFKTRASGYLVGKLTKSELQEELNDLNIGTNSAKNHMVVAKTFGNFELFCDDVAIKFERAKSKELVAYLIDKKGTSATASELIVNLWEDRDVDRTTRSMLHNLISDIRATLTKYGILDILDIKRNAFRVDDNLLSCDYYDVISGKENAKNKFTGEYMNNYSWAEFTSASLCKICNRY